MTKGFVLGWGRDITLIHFMEEETFRLNGYRVFRNRDVKRWRPVPPDDFLARAARLNRVRPVRPDGVTVESLRSAIASAGASFPLITLSREQIKKDVCFIGRVVRVSQRALTMVEISPEAEWEDEEHYLLRDITLLDFDGNYERLLVRMSKSALPIRGA